jgi:hypothetical protein
MTVIICMVLAVAVGTAIGVLGTLLAFGLLDLLVNTLIRRWRRRQLAR